MEQRKDHYLDKKSFVALLESLMCIIEDKKKNKESIKRLEGSINTIIKENQLDKEKLISKWISISGNDHFESLKVTTIKDYFTKLSIVLKSSAIYMNKFNDPLYLLAQLSIITDWYLYRKINLDLK